MWKLNLWQIFQIRFKKTRSFPASLVKNGKKLICDRLQFLICVSQQAVQYAHRSFSLFEDYSLLYFFFKTQQAWICMWSLNMTLFDNHLGFSEILFWQANVANLPNLPNWPWPMKESIHLIGGLFGHVYKHLNSKCVHILNMSSMWHEKFKWLNTRFCTVPMVEHK